MSGRTAAVLCLAAFLAAAAPPWSPPWSWMTAAWNALTAAVEEPSVPEEEDPEDGTDEGWLIDPNG